MNRFDPELAEEYELYMQAVWPTYPNDLGIALAVMAHKFYDTEGEGVEVCDD